MDISGLSFDQKLDLSFDPKTPSEILEVLANDEVQGAPGSYDENFALRRNVAGNPNAPIHLLKRLAGDDESEVRWEVAKNPSITQEMIEAFSKDEDYIAAVASNEKCPSETLQAFAKIKDDSVREAIAANPNCPLALIKKWAKLKDESIRACVSGNPSTPVEILESLAADDEASVRMMVACNPSCPAHLLVQLSEDDDSEVRRYVAQSECCSAEVLGKLEHDAEEAVVSAVAGNANTSIDVLERLAVHEFGKVRIAVANNPNCSAELRKQALTVPPCSFPDSDLLKDVMTPVLEIKSLIDKARSECPAHAFLNHHGIKDLDYCAPAWGLKLFDLPTQHADRTRSMLEGPFFTSEKYPWPSGGDTRYASPLVQMDLREISRLKGTDYGDGLLQVFSVDTNFEIRVIPREDVAIDQMTASIPEDESDLSGEFTHKYWLGYGGFVSQIIGYEDPVLSANVYASDGAPDDEDPEILKEIFSRMESLSLNDSGTHMFGTFYPIQYRHSEIGGEVLMALDSDLCYAWGDSGNAQIFVNRSQDGSLHFHAEWSCY
jgi:hypothetical protein